MNNIVEGWRHSMKLSNIFKAQKWVEFFCGKKITQKLSDSKYIRLKYYSKMGCFPDLKNPLTFNEKIQWLKLHDHNPQYTILADKYLVKQYIADKLGEDHVIPLLGVWKHATDIKFETLPEQFVLKCNHDSGKVYICRDKSRFDKERAVEELEKALRVNCYLSDREWSYKDIPRCVIAEKYMEDKSQCTLKDYKFYCFNGEPKFLYVSEGLENQSTAKMSYVTLEWKLAPFQRTDYARLDSIPDPPVNFEKMVNYARLLSESIPFVRVDFYEINEQIYFGEMTFYPAGGHSKFDPPEWDKIIGGWLDLSAIELTEKSNRRF